MNLTYIRNEDLPIFMDIINSLFPDITPPESKNDILIDAIKQCMVKNNQQPSTFAVSKIVQLYETKSFRRSVIITGQSGSAKSTTWKTLRDTLALLKKERVNNFENVIVSQ